MSRRLLVAVALGVALGGCSQVGPPPRGSARQTGPVGIVPLDPIAQTINGPGAGTPGAPASMAEPPPVAIATAPVALPDLAPVGEVINGEPTLPAPSAMEPAPVLADATEAPVDDLRPVGATADEAGVPPRLADLPPLPPGVAVEPAPAEAPLVVPGRRADETAARVGDEIITLSELNTAVRDRLREASMEGPPDRAMINQVASAVLDRMIDRTLILQKAKATVKNPAGWKQLNELADEAFRKERLPVLLKQTASENEYELKRKFAERSINYDELKTAFRQDHLAKQFLMAQLAPKMRVDLPDIRAYYAEHKGDFARDALVTWREVVVRNDRHADPAEARAKADRALARLRRGESFATVATAESEGPNAEAGGLWETTPGSYAVPAVNEAVETLPIGQVSPLIEGPDGFHVVVVEARREAGPAPFADVQGQIREKLLNAKYERELTEFVQDLHRGAVITTMFDGTASAPTLTRGNPAAGPATADR